MVMLELGIGQDVLDNIQEAAFGHLLATTGDHRHTVSIAIPVAPGHY